ncbi:MAG: tyrosine-type recombinase/integrase [Thermoplasmataceae archaeon]
MKSEILDSDTLTPISNMPLRVPTERRVPDLPDYEKRKVEKSRSMNYLTREEFARLRSYIASNGKMRNRNVLMIQIIYETGVRVSDALHIRPKDVDFNRKTIHVYIQKSGKWSLKPISMELGYLLSVYLNQNPVKLDESIIDLTRNQAWKIITDAGKSSLGRRVTPHTIRHSVAMAIRNNGGSYDDVKDALDHSSVEISEEFYAEADLEKKREVLVRAGILSQ